MINVDYKSLLEHLNPYCKNCLESAAGLCVYRTQYEVTVEHFWLKLLEDSGSDVALICRQFDIDQGQLLKLITHTVDDFQTGNTGRPVFSPLLMEWLQDSWMITSIDLKEPLIRSGSLFLAFLQSARSYAAGKYIEIFDDINKDKLISQVGNILSESVEKTSIQDSTEGVKKTEHDDSTALGRFCINFTEKARSNEIDPVFGRDNEIRQIIDILARRRKNNPIAVGEPGVGKTAVVEGLALRVVEKDVPELLRDVIILGLDLGLLQAGAGMKGEFENRLKSVIKEIKAHPKPVILFIDEAHTIIGSGNASGGNDAANLLKPALARGELRTIAATTWSEYKKYFEKDAALARRFQLVKLDEPSVDTTILILRGLKKKYEETHGVVIRDDAIIAAAELSKRYISGRQLPDKAVDLLDTSAARTKILLSAKPEIIEAKERSIQALEREKKALERDQIYDNIIDDKRLSIIDYKLTTMNSELKTLKNSWLKEQELAHKLIKARQTVYEIKEDSDVTLNETDRKKDFDLIKNELNQIQSDSPIVRTEVDADVVAKVVSDWTGIPLGKVMRDQAKNILDLESSIKQKIKGQDVAINNIIRVIKSSKAGLKDPQQPMGIFLLVGPSGVGKTETGLTLANDLFGGDQFMITINMSEFQEKHSVSRLIGSPPGYVGYGEGGLLTEAVRQKPYALVLLDEVEKADLEVMNLFYQVFDKGVLSDGEGRQIDFKNTIIFLTSNLASDVITEMYADDEDLPLDVIVSAIRPILSNHFKPALLARMNIIPFKTLSPSIMENIVLLKLDKLAKRLMSIHKMKLDCSADVIKQISSRCIEVEIGARNVDHIMNETILPLLSGEILGRMSKGNFPSEVQLLLDEDGNFQTLFKE